MGTPYNDFFNCDLYDFSDLHKKAIAPGATQEDIDKLGYWMSRHGRDSWNGEYYSVDSTHELYPIYKEVGYDDYELIGYTFSSFEPRLIMRDMTDEERETEEEEKEKSRKERREWEEEQRKKEEPFMVMPVNELVERYSIGIKRFSSPNGSPIRIGKRHQAMEDGAENAILRRRKAIKKFLQGKQQTEERR